MKKLVLLVETWADGSVHILSPNRFYGTTVDETGLWNVAAQIAGLTYPHEEGEIELVQK